MSETATAASSLFHSRLPTPPFRGEAERLVIVVNSGNGGVGKTTLTLAIENWLAVNGLEAHFVESDHEKASILPRVGGERCSVVPFVLPKRDGVLITEQQTLGDRLYDLIDRHPIVVVDLGAGADEAFFEWFRLNAYDSVFIPSMKIRWVYCTVISGERESNDCLEKFLGYGFQNVEHIIWLNGHKGGSFAAYEHGDVRARARRAGAREEVIPTGEVVALEFANHHALTLTRLVQDADAHRRARSYDAAGAPCTPDGAPTVHPLVAARLAGWLRRMGDRLDARLGPA